jgi:DNA-binding transcriptional ArsR family regulator/protein-L-isoaspartate O-methyltransferase
VATFLQAVSALRAAAEPTRLRLLALLSRAELTVGEICEIVGQSQPRVSRHLKVLSDAGLAHRFREEHWVYYRAPSSGPARSAVQQLLALVDEHDDVLRRDARRLEDVIAERARRIVAGAPQIESDGAYASIDAVVLRELESEPIGALLDVGTGAGRLLGLLGAQATRAVGVDISSEALRLARAHVHGAGLSHCELQQGDMYDLPFTAPAFDTATVDRVLASAERPVAALKEIARTLRPGGRVVLIEDFDALSASERNPIAVVRAWLQRAGFETTRIHPIDTESTHLLVAVARRAVRTSAAA